MKKEDVKTIVRFYLKMNCKIDSVYYNWDDNGSIIVNYYSPINGEKLNEQYWRPVKLSGRLNSGFQHNEKWFKMADNIIKEYTS